MIGYRAHADPPCTLADRLHQLNDNLQTLAARLKEAIATAISNTVGDAIRDVLRRLLGTHEVPLTTDDRFDDRFERESDPWREYGDDPWAEEEQEGFIPRAPEPAARKRWRDAFTTAIQTGLWWLRQQPCRRPILTTTIVTVAAGGAAFVAGPTFAACVSVVASIASLLLTADAARSAGGALTD